MANNESTTVHAVQMVEFNPATGNLRKSLTISGVGVFVAGNAVAKTPFVPSAIVPIKDPGRMMRYGDREVGLFDLLTGQDPTRPGAFYFHQPGKPGLPVFRRIQAPSMDDLQKAVAVQAQRAAQAGQPIPPAPIVGQVGASLRPNEGPPPTVEEILRQGAAADAASAQAAPAAPTPASVATMLEEVTARTRTVRSVIMSLDANPSTVAEDDLARIEAHSSKALREWAAAERDRRAAAALSA
jgi:hypothetical protein